jgi:hypothetical protein
MGLRHQDRFASETKEVAVSRPLPRFAALAAVGLLSACVTTPRAGPVDVTRFHLGAAAVVPGTVEVTTRNNFAGVSPEDGLYTGAVGAELQHFGFAAAPAGSSQFVALVSYVHRPAGTVRTRPPVTIGIGTGSYGRSGGVDVGGSFGIGGGTAQVIATELSVEIRRRTDNTIVWEGHATSQALGGAKGEQPAVTAQRLAAALFKGFPGESGITITVK